MDYSADHNDVTASQAREELGQPIFIFSINTRHNECCPIGLGSQPRGGPSLPFVTLRSANTEVPGLPNPRLQSRRKRKAIEGPGRMLNPVSRC